MLPDNRIHFKKIDNLNCLFTKSTNKTQFNIESIVRQDINGQIFKI